MFSYNVFFFLFFSVLDFCVNGFNVFMKLVSVLCEFCYGFLIKE